MRRLTFFPFFRSNRAVSYAVSAIIITGTTLTLVMVASIYAYQIMERQRGYAEFETAQKSLLTFNDGLENSAWKVGAARSTRFTIKYGYLQLVPVGNTLSIDASVGGWSQSVLSHSASVIRYCLSNNYVSFDPSFQTYILGDSSSYVTGSAGSYGRAVIKCEAGLATVNLDYRVRVLGASIVEVTGTGLVNYVNIRVIKLSMLVSTPWSYVNDFDLTAKCINIDTESFDAGTTSANQAFVNVRLGASSEQVPVPLDWGQAGSGRVVFTVSVAEMQVNV